MKKIFFIVTCGLLLTTGALATEFQLFTTTKQAQNSDIGVYISTSNKLKEAQIGDTISGIENYQIIVTSRETHNNGDVTLFGKIDDTNYRAIITRGENGTFARIHTEGGVYRIKTTAGGEKLFSPQDYDTFSPSLPDKGGVIPPKILNDSKKKPNKSSTINSPIAQLTNQSDTRTTTIDIMVFWDLDYQRNGGGPTSLNQLIALANSDFLASNIYIRLNLVYSGLKGSLIGDFLDNGDMLTALRDNNDFYGFGDVNALRATHKADLVGYVRQANNIVNANNCGVAYKLGSNGSMPNAYRANAFFVVNDDKGNICQDYVFSHEIGHNLGSNHDRRTVQEGGSGDSSSNHIFPYSFGYGGRQNSDNLQDFGTIMSYVSPEKNTYLFSNPNLNCDLRVDEIPGSPPSVSCGRVGYADNARGFNAVRNAVAGFDTDSSNNAQASEDGNAQASEDGSGCFIATAAYGSYFAPKVKILRQFRDEKMLTNSFGRFLVAQYYQYSPPIANYIKNREWLRSLTRTILTPIVYFVENIYIFYMTLILILIFIFRKKLTLNRV